MPFANSPVRQYHQRRDRGHWSQHKDYQWAGKLLRDVRFYTGFTTAFQEDRSKKRKEDKDVLHELQRVPFLHDTFPRFRVQYSGVSFRGNITFFERWLIDDWLTGLIDRRFTVAANERWEIPFDYMGPNRRLARCNSSECDVTRTSCGRLVSLERHGRLHASPFQHVQRIADPINNPDH